MSEDNKDVSVESVLAEGGVETTPGHEELKKGTQRDERDMIRMGKVQETRVSGAACYVVSVVLIDW